MADHMVETLNPLAQALRNFDAVTRSPGDPVERHNAWIGTAVALRLSQRFDESLRAVDKLIADKPAYALAVRAQYERGRTLLAAGRFAEARAALGRLATVRLD